MWGGNGKRVLGQHIHDKSSAVNLVIEEHHSIKNNVSYFNKKNHPSASGAVILHDFGIMEVLN